MWRKTLALISAVITGASIVASSAVGQTRVVTSDATAQFVPLEVGKFIVIDLPVDAKDVLVANPAIAHVVMRTARRAYVLANSAGQTNIAFFDATRRQIEAFDLSVQTYPVQANPPPGPENVVIVFRGSAGRSLSCTHTSKLSEGAACYAREDETPTLDSLPKGSSVTMPAGK